MKLNAKNKKTQAKILDRLKKGLPLAGLLTALSVGAGCSRHTVGDVPHVMGKKPAPPLMGDVYFEPEKQNPECPPEKEPQPEKETTPPRLMGVIAPPKEDKPENP